MGGGARAHPESSVSRELIIRPEAEAEMAEAFDWYEDRVAGLGSDFLLCLDAAFQSILRDPQHFPLVYRSARRALTRRFPYEVLFVDDDASVVVLSVFHAKRNPKDWQLRS